MEDQGRIPFDVTAQGAPSTRPNAPATDAASSNQGEHPISLPRGGGAVRGIAETFKVNAATGTASFSIPLPVSPARGFEPELALSYDSGSGNGPFGLGWALGIGSIRRRTEKGLPRYDDAQESDTYLLGGAEELVPLLKFSSGEWRRQVTTKSLDGVSWEVKLYRPRTEGGFARIERWRDPEEGTVWWRVTSADNVTSVYGYRAGARIADPDHPQRIFSWLIDCRFDDKGHYTQYDFKPEDLGGVDLQQCFEAHRASEAAPPQRYLKRVLYGIKESTIRQGLSVEDIVTTEFAPDRFHFQTVFDYGDHDDTAPGPEESKAWEVRHDPFSDYRAGFEVRSWRRCRRVLSFHQFDNELPSDSELVRSVALEYRDDPGNFSFLTGIRVTGHKRADNGDVESATLPRLSFAYQDHAWSTEVKSVERESMVDLPAGVDGRQYQWVDLYGEGLSGVVAEHAGNLYYKSNLGEGRFGESRAICAAPSFQGLVAGELQIRDLDANGVTQLVSMPARGYFTLGEDGRWSVFQRFSRLPGIDPDDPNLRVIDLTGDGTADLVVSEDSVFCWYPSEGTRGYGEARRTVKARDEDEGPAVVFANESESVFLADMCGDGLQDIVRIRNADVVYWPNLGFGRFGAKVVMGGAPRFDFPDQFHPRYLRLADLDGSGTTDLVYLGKNEFRYWLNLNGNRFGDPAATLNPFPDVDSLSNVSVIDLLGGGTACVVCSSPRGPGSLRYVDLMAGKKPYLMVGYENGMGKEVRLEYTPSTHFYLEDKSNGEPWVTRLHFPVQCLTKVETVDHVTGARFASSYTYHHGYYDHAEREFRGFGRVDQLDTEDFDHFVVEGSSNVVEHSLHQPPVLTKTWIHTGVFIDREHVLSLYRQEYFQSETTERFGLPEPGLPDELSAAEWREALRACKGLALRTEVYGLDGTGLEPYPYSITETTAEIRRVQPRGQNRHGVFQTLGTESLALQLDRNPDDPRIRHDFALAFDAYGRPTVSAVVGYGRLEQDASLPAEVRDLQGQGHAVVSTASFTGDEFGIVNGFDMTADLERAYRLPVVWRRETYELCADLAAERTLFARADLLQAFDTASPVGYENEDRALGTRRLLSRDETRSANDTLDGPRPPAQASPLGIPWQSWQLAFTPALLEHVFEGRVDPASFFGGHVDLNTDGDWWVPSATPIFGADAAQRFFLADGSRDPFGTPSWVDHDAYLLLPVRTRDARHNETVAVNDYRVLGPRFVRDPNDNWTAVETDALGLVVASAAMGKVDGVGSGDHPAADAVCEGDNLRHPGMQFNYDLDAWTREQRPARATTVAWEEHYFSNPSRQRSLTRHEYTDGLGNVVMTKAQTRPGVARQAGDDGRVIEVDTRTFDPPGLRWLGNGRTVLNNKGKVVKQYEPYFSVTPDYEDAAVLVETGVTPILFYDAPGRLACRLNPNHTYEKIVFSPWRQSRWDVNDTLYLINPDDSIATNPTLDPDVGQHFGELAPSDYLPTWYEARIDGDLGSEEQRAAQVTASRFHAATPAVFHTDALGRTVYSLADNGSGNRYETHTRLDIEGNTRAIMDDRGNTVMRYRYNMLPAPGGETLKSALYQHSMDSGDRWTLSDVLGRPIRRWNDRGHSFELEYDQLSRPTRNWVVEDGERKLVEVASFCDSDHLDAVAYRARNLIGTFHEALDQAGRTEIGMKDFRGNTLSATRTPARDYRQTVNWNVPDREVLLESEAFTTASEFDALDRTTLARSPHHAGIPASITRPTYDESGGFARMYVSVRGGPEIVHVERIEYDAKGQRQWIEYGNGVVTAYEYEPDTFRLKRLHTRNGVSVLQDIEYTYDPVGNPTEIRDQAHQDIFFRNIQVEPRSEYEYDAVYRLIRATGREHATQVAVPHPDNGWNAEPHPNDGQAMQRYVQTYEYDGVGNILGMTHSRPSAGDGWNRHYQYQDASNRLLATTRGDPTQPFDEPYSYNAHGSVTSMQHLPSMVWSFAERLHHVDLGGGGSAFYVYDSTGLRSRKVIETNGSLVKERIYLGGWEIYREHNSGGLRLERETLHVMDDNRRIAVIETKTIDRSGTAGFESMVRYQLGNHLGSASLELDGDGRVISYEEFHPFGTTSYYAGSTRVQVAPKRYRYIGKERDEETGFSSHDARLLYVGIGRWLSTDPSGLHDGINLYRYARNNPIRLLDPTGFGSQESWGDYGASWFSVDAWRESLQGYALSRNPMVPSFNALEDARNGVYVDPHDVQQETFGAVQNLLTDVVGLAGSGINPASPAAKLSPQRVKPFLNSGTRRVVTETLEQATTPGSGRAIVEVASEAGTRSYLTSGGVTVPVVSSFGERSAQSGGAVASRVARELPGEFAENVSDKLPSRMLGNKQAAIREALAQGDALIQFKGKGAAREGVVFSGHGEIAGPSFVVPEGTTLSIYARPGDSISNALGNAIEEGLEGAVAVRTYQAGDIVPGLMLHANEGGVWGAFKGTPIVNWGDDAVPLENLLRPGMGDVHWAACLKDEKMSPRFVWDVWQRGASGKLVPSLQKK